MKKYATNMDLAQVVCYRDVYPSALGSALSSMFLGQLEVFIETDKGFDCYTYMRKPGKAVVHIGIGFACLAAGLAPNAPVQDVEKTAKKLKTAMYGAAYHELGHLKKSDMTGEPYKQIPATYLPFADFIKKGTNTIEDPAMERDVKKDPYLKRLAVYFRWINNNYFAKEAKTYVDEGSPDSFLDYLLLYLRVGPQAISGRNAMYDALVPKGIEAKLRDAYKERNARQRLIKQIEFFEWVIDELGLQPPQAQVSPFHERAVIVVVDPKNGKKSTLQPQTSPSQQPEDGQQAESESTSQNQGETQGEGEKEGEGQAQSGENENGEGQNGDTKKPGGRQAGTEAGDGSSGCTKEPLFDWEIGNDDPIEVMQTEGLDSKYDPELMNALRVDAESKYDSRVYKAYDTYDVKDPAKARQAFDDCTKQAAGVSSGLAYALTELKAETAPVEIHNLSDGDDISVDDYIDSVRSGAPSFEIYIDERKGREITDLAVYLLVDCSGSMVGEESKLAYLTSCVVTIACKEADIPSEIAAFSTGGILIVKTFEDDPDEAIPRIGLLYGDIDDAYNNHTPSIGLWGGTDCESALALALGRIRNYDEKACKLLFVITDGDTGSPDTTGKLVAKAREEGIVVIGIGINTSLDNLSRCFGHCKVFDHNSLGQLPGYVAEEIREAMASDDFQGY